MDRCTVRFLFITLFPEQIEQAAGHSIIKRAVDAGLVEVSCINPRDLQLTGTVQWTIRPLAAVPAWF